MEGLGAAGLRAGGEIGLVLAGGGFRGGGPGGGVRLLPAWAENWPKRKTTSGVTATSGRRGRRVFAAFLAKRSARAFGLKKPD